MNRALPEMLHCMNTPGNVAGSFTDMSVLERQRARIKWQQEQLLNQQPCYFEGNDQFNGYSMPNHGQDFHNLINSTEMGLVVKADPGLDNGWQEFGQFGGEGSVLGSSGFVNGSGFELNYGISRTISCPQEVAAAMVEAVAVTETARRESVSPEKMSSAVGRESFKKRKADKNQSLKAVAEEEPNEKRIKECNEEDESKITEEHSNNSRNTTNNDNNIKRETSADTSKDNSKVSEVQKPDYIHVRARRGQATDSHSLAERARNRSSERMGGMEIETYGAEVGEESDYDDEDDVESEDLAALRKKFEEGEQELARLNREYEKKGEELAGLRREKKELTELIVRNNETIARLKAENSRTRCGIGYLPEDMARKDEEHARFKAAIARLRTKLGFLPMYPGEKEVMVRRAIKEYVLRKQQELEAGKSEKEMLAATPNLSHLEI